MMQSSFSHVIGLSSAYRRGLCACIAHSISARQQESVRTRDWGSRRARAGAPGKSADFTDGIEGLLDRPALPTVVTVAGTEHLLCPLLGPVCIILVKPHGSPERYRWRYLKGTRNIHEVVHKKHWEQCLAQRARQRTPPVVTLLSPCRSCPLGPAALSGTCAKGLYLSLLLFPFPCSCSFSWSLIARALVNTKILLTFCVPARVFMNFSRCGMEKEMTVHSRILAWRIPGMAEPGGLPSMGSHRVGHDWSDLAAAAAEARCGKCSLLHILPSSCLIHHLRVAFL